MRCACLGTVMAQPDQLDSIGAGPHEGREDNGEDVMYDPFGEDMYRCRSKVTQRSTFFGCLRRGVPSYRCAPRSSVLQQCEKESINWSS